MNITKLTAQKKATAAFRSAISPTVISYVARGSAIAPRLVKIRRRYHRSLSKQSMKLKRYRQRGSTQRNGTGAMFCVRWLVTASISAEAHAARDIQSRRSESRGA